MHRGKIVVLRHHDSNPADIIDHVSSTQEENIGFRKTLGSLFSYQAERCEFCGTIFGNSKEHGRCKSHSIPNFLLQQIALGKPVKNSNAFIQAPWSALATGVNSSGTFYLICRSCDSTIFQDYEDSKIYTSAFRSTPNLQLILNEIAIKNYLFGIYDHRKVASGLQSMKEHWNAEVDDQTMVFGDQLDNQIIVETADIRDNERSFSRARYLQRRYTNRQIFDDEYNLDFCYVYERTFPIVFQSKVTVEFDCWKNHINNLREYDASTQDFHLCVFSYGGTTTVLAFSKIADAKISLIRNHLRSLSADNAAKALLAMGMSSSTNFFIDPSVSSSLFENDYLRKLTGEDGTIETHVFSDYPVARETVERSIRDNQVTGAKQLIERYVEIPNMLIGL